MSNLRPNLDDYDATPTEDDDADRAAVPEFYELDEDEDL